MSVEMTRETMAAYIKALVAREPYAQFFAEGVTFTVMGSGDPPIKGRKEVAEFIQWLHTLAFDARPEIKEVFSVADRACLEAEFVGRHTGEFFGVPGSGREVRVPYTVVYDLRGAQITALRFYMPMNVLMEQIKAPAKPMLATA
jgi:predicted ester cyclase